MGWFDANDSDYNKALTHFRNARDVLPNGSLYYKEMSIASSYLKELIKKNEGTADALVVLANIYYAIYTLVSSSQLEPNKDVGEYLGLSAALMHHWKTGWRGYNKNSKQGKQLYEMIASTLMQNNPEISSKADIDMIFNMCHENYYETALIKEINPQNHIIA